MTGREFPLNLILNAKIEVRDENIENMEKNRFLENPVFPDWLSIYMAVKEKIPELNTINKRFYHYTSIDGFMSILQNRDFWISNIRFMNDSQEFENGKEICQRIVKDKLESCDSNTKVFLEKILDRRISQSR